MDLVSRRSLALLAAVFASSVACSKSEDSSARYAEEVQEVTPVSAPRPSAPSPAPQMTARQDHTEQTPARAPEDEEGRTDAAMTISDEQIVAVLSAMEERDIELAKLAAARSKSQLVQNYAAMVIAHRKDAMSKRRGLVEQAGMTPQPSETSLVKSEDMQEDFDALKGKTGRGFDMAFVEVMMENQREALSFIDDQALVSVKSAPLKSLVQSSRSSIDSDFTSTQDLKRMLEQGPVQKPKQPEPKPEPAPPGV